MPATRTLIDPFFGVICERYQWVPSLRYLLRRERLLDIMNRFARGKLLELGCAAGTLLCELREMGFDCTGVETSSQALALAKSISSELAYASQRQSSPQLPSTPRSPSTRELPSLLPLHASAQDVAQENFDYVCAFDVLEHIEDHAQAITQWIAKLNPQGALVLSVPAHGKRWSAGDVWAGHYRRYDEPALRYLLTAHGLVIEHFECYGFPLANLTEWLGRLFYRNATRARSEAQLAQDQAVSKATASANSGIQRNFYFRLFKLLNNPLGKALLNVAFRLQHATLRTNLGSGYIVVARKQ